MSEPIEVKCPCCSTQLTVDASSGEILHEERPKGPVKSFEDAFSEVKSGARKREDAFQKAVDRNKHQEDILQKKFEEAMKRTEDDGERPRNPLDLD